MTHGFFEETIKDGKLFFPEQLRPDAPLKKLSCWPSLYDDGVYVFSELTPAEVENLTDELAGVAISELPVDGDYIILSEEMISSFKDDGAVTMVRLGRTIELWPTAKLEAGTVELSEEIFNKAMEELGL